MKKPMVWMMTGLVVVTLTISAVTSQPNIDKALTRQLDLVAETPEASGYNDLGNLLLLAGRFEEAEEAYRRAIELDPMDPGPRFNLGVLQQQQRKSRAAGETYRELLEIYPQHAWANYQMGVLLADRGGREQAIDRYARAFAADPSLTFPQYNPHFIDNPLATEGMLRAKKYGTSLGTVVPRQYSAPERIAEWMLEHEALDPAADEAEEWQTTETTEVLGSSSPSTLRQAQPVGSADEEAAESTAGRTLTADDLETSRVGQASSGSSTRRYSPGTSLRGRSVGGTPSTSRGTPSARPSTRPSTIDRESAASRLRSNRIGSSPRPNRGTPTNDGRVAPGSTLQRNYPPSRLSTGRLDLELLPGSAPQERLAQRVSTSGVS